MALKCIKGSFTEIVLLSITSTGLTIESDLILYIEAFRFVSCFLLQSVQKT